jgi:hypothetical protein
LALLKFLPSTHSWLNIGASATPPLGIRRWSNSTNGAGNGSFQIVGDSLETNGTPAAGTYKVCVAAIQAGTSNGSLAGAFTITAGNLIKATNYCASNGGGDGSSSNPWKDACIQAAVNAAAAGDTVFLAAGNWTLPTNGSGVTISKVLNLVGAGSGNTFDAYGHPNNANGSASGTVTRVFTSGTVITNAPGGFIACRNGGPINVSHIFFDGSVSTTGNDSTATMTFDHCADPNQSVGPLVNDVRSWGYVGGVNNPNCSFSTTGCAETQFWMYWTGNATIQNSVFATPPVFLQAGEWPAAQIFQTGVDPVSWTLFHLRRRCWDAEESPAIRAGISAPDGRAGAVRPNAGGAVTRVRANGASDLELGAPSRT